MFGCSISNLLIISFVCGQGTVWSSVLFNTHVYSKIHLISSSGISYEFLWGWQLYFSKLLFLGGKWALLFHILVASELTFIMTEDRIVLLVLSSLTDGDIKKLIFSPPSDKTISTCSFIHFTSVGLSNAFSVSDLVFYED